MSKQDNKGARFTGGDNLTGILKIYHDLMMRNELFDGKGAYKLSYAEGKSGPSFGGNQMDIAVNEDARKALFDIIKNAKGKVDGLTLSNSDIQVIKEKLVPENESPEELALRLPTLKGKADQVFGAKIAAEINKILSSVYGMRAVDKIYPNEVQRIADKIERAVSNIKQPAAKEFYSTTLGKVLLFDYDNQYYLKESNPNAKMVSYLDNGYTTTYTGKILKFSKSYNFEYHKEFLLGTEQANNPKYTQNSINRLNYIISVSSSFPDAEVKAGTEKQTHADTQKAVEAPQQKSAQKAEKQAQAVVQKQQQEQMAQAEAAKQNAETEKQAEETKKAEEAKKVQETAEQSAAGSTYTVQQGDNLSAIAQKNNMTLEQLLAIPGNEQFRANPNVIQPNQQVKIQAAATTSDNQTQVDAQKAAEAAKQKSAQEAENSKQAEEAKQKAEAEKQAQAVVQKQQQEQGLQAEAAKQKAETEKQAQEAEAAKQKAETEKQAAEQAKQAEETKKAEEAKKVQETAEQSAADSTYTVQKGDNLSAIAQKNNMTLEQLLSIPGNEQFKANPNMIQPNQQVKIQATATTSDNQTQVDAQKAAEAAKQKSAQEAEAVKQAEETKKAEEAKKVQETAEQSTAGSTYTVQQGDNLSAVAQKNNMTLEQLLAIPGNEQFKANPNLIQPNQQVKLPQAIQALEQQKQAAQAEAVKEGVEPAKQEQAVAETAVQEQRAANRGLTINPQLADLQIKEQQKHFQEMDNSAKRHHMEMVGAKLLSKDNDPIAEARHLSRAETDQRDAQRSQENQKKLETDIIKPYA